MPHSLEIAAQTIAWITAFAWAVHAVTVLRGLPRVPDLLQLPDPPSDPAAPSLTVIVPACNEAKDIAACLHSLVAQDYPNLNIVAINDRSTDQTGALMDALAAQHPTRLRVLHITELPSGWLGKTHAMALAARHTTADYLLFTDADILFHPTVLRRALSYLVKSRGDHLVTFPTLLIKRWDEAA